MGTAVQFEDLSRGCGEWLRGSGPEADIVISSRVRLARNLAAYPFISRATSYDRAEVERTLREAILGIHGADELLYLNVEAMEPIDRQFLVERQLISREHAEGQGARGVAIDSKQQISLMVNEEDHLRIQVMYSGLDLWSAWERINAIDDLVESRVYYAFHERLGYLTACPTNVGTGMRVSVMLHLPALVMTREIEKVFRSLQKISVTVRGLYGEGSQPAGDFYQISNQATLGRSEREIITQLGHDDAVVPRIIKYEREARAALLDQKRDTLSDLVNRAYGILRSARMITAEETMLHLSRLRMGVNMGLLGQLRIATINQLFVYTQPAHLQKLCGRELDSSDRNIERARYIRQHLHPEEGSQAQSN
jgi:protein arginine kinase